MQLLVEICRHSSPSRHEHDFVEWLVDYIMEHYPEAIVETDDYDNIYVTKGEAETYSCIVGHSDCVPQPAPDTTVCQVGDILFGYSELEKRPVGLGFDDKTGIYVALKMLEKHPALKVAFFTGEEIGCIGSGKADMTFFDNCRFVLQCDRRGNSDFITTAAGTELCSTAFKEAVNFKEYGYAETNGLTTDVKELKHRGLKVSACNISCGYYNPHTEKECQSLTDVEKCIKLVDHIITDCTEVYPHEKPKPSYSYGTNSYGSHYKGGKHYYGYDYDDDYDDYYGYTGMLFESEKKETKKDDAVATIFTDSELETFAKEYINSTQYPSEYGFVYDFGSTGDKATDDKLRKIYNKVYNEINTESRG